MGRKKKLTQSKKDILITLIANGNTITNVCEAMGIDTSTYRKERARDKKFADSVDEAKEIRLHLVEDALYLSAISGNVLAQKFYLVNRGGGAWKEMQYVKQESKSQVSVENDEFTKRILANKESRELFHELLERIYYSEDGTPRSDENGSGETVSP